MSLMERRTNRRSRKMGCNRFCQGHDCGVPLDCDWEGDLCMMCLADRVSAMDNTPLDNDDLLDSEFDEDNVPTIDHVRG